MEWMRRPLARLGSALALMGVLLPSAAAERAVQPPAPQVAAPAVAARPAPVILKVAPVEPAPAPLPAPPPPPPAPVTPQRVMLIGDSMAYTAAEGLAPHASAASFSIINEGIFGCGVVRGGPYRYVGVERQADARCEAWPSLWQAAAERHRPEVVAILVGRWELMDRVHDGRWTNIFDHAFAGYIESEVDHALTVAGMTGARVVVFSTPYYQRGQSPGGGLWAEDDPARVDAVNAILRRVAERRGVSVLDVGGWLSPEGRYSPEVGGIKVRSDGVHLTRQTGDVLAPRLFPELRQLLSTPADGGLTRAASRVMWFSAR